MLTFVKKARSLEKKLFQHIHADKILKAVCRNVFKINGSRDISTFSDLTFPKAFPSQWNY